MTRRAPLALVLLILLLTPLALAESPDRSKLPEIPPVDDPVWVQAEKSPTLKTYWAKLKGTDIIAMRGEALVDQPLDKVASVIVDTTRGTEWIDSLVRSRIVREMTPRHFIEYDEVGIPFPFDTLISNRDFVSDTRIAYDAKVHRVTVTYLPVEDDQVPPKKPCVRGLAHCVFKMTPTSVEGQTLVEAEVLCDPEGGLAPWLVNFFQEGWPKNTFERLRRQAAKPDIQVIPRVAALLGERHLAKAAKGH